MNIDFNPRLFNPNFWHIYKSMRDTTIRSIWAYGGSSSSKTFSFAQNIIITTLEEGSDTRVFRKTGNSIEATVYKDFCEIINDWGLSELFKITKSPMRITCQSGGVISFQGADDTEKIKGIKEKRVYLNEVSAFDVQDYNQIRKRLRGLEGQQILCDFNPVDEQHWIKLDVFDNEEQHQLPVTCESPLSKEYTEVTEKWQNGYQTIVNPKGEKQIIPPNMVVIRSTYLNNFWVVGSPCGEYGFQDIHTIADFEKDKKNDYNFYKIYALGEWGKVSVGGEFYKAFKTAEHVISGVKYDPELPLHISFDENVNPYLSLAIYQAQGKRLWQIDEITLENPNNTLSHTLTEFKRRYPVNKSGLYIYGDRTSLKEDTKLEKGQNFYTIVENTLRAYNPVRRLPSKNPPVAMRGNFINECIFGDKMDISFLINDNCKKSITDFQYVKEASDGTKLKEKAKNPNTGVTYEKYGHLSDVSDYIICEYFRSEFAKYQRGDEVRPVIGMRGGSRRGAF